MTPVSVLIGHDFLHISRDRLLSLEFFSAPVQPIDCWCRTGETIAVGFVQYGGKYQFEWRRKAALYIAESASISGNRNALFQFHLLSKSELDTLNYRM